MGVIKRQGIKFSFVNYLGVALGAISSVFIYPHNKELYGLFGFLLDTANIFVPFALMGTTSISIQFFPMFADEKKGHNGFLFWLLALCTFGSILLMLLLWIFQTQIYDYYAAKSSPLYIQYIYAIVPISIFYVFIIVLKQYCSNFHRIVIPGLLDQLIKFTFPLLFILFINGSISMDYVIYGIVFNYVLYLLGMIWYVRSLKQFFIKPNFSFLNKSMLDQIIPYAAYGMIGSAGSIIALRIDTFMVGSLTNLFDTGVYKIASLIAFNIAVPYAAINSISSPIISKAWKDNNMAEIDLIYKKSSINLLSFGLICFIGILFCIDDLFHIMPKGDEMQGAKYVVIIIAATKLFDLATGVNDIITGYSHHYRFNFWSVMTLALLNIVGNLILIPMYGILGAAYAIMISSITYNVVKYAYIKKYIGMTPFTINTLKLLAIGAFCILIGCVIPSFSNTYINIVVKAMILGISYSILLYKFNISDDVTNLAKPLLKKIGL